MLFFCHITAEGLKKALPSELAALYHELWEIEMALDELEAHLRGARIDLCSETPDLVKREFCGFLMAHFAILSPMHEAAWPGNADSNTLSFLYAARAIRRKM